MISAPVSARSRPGRVHAVSRLTRTRPQVDDRFGAVVVGVGVLLLGSFAVLPHADVVGLIALSVAGLVVWRVTRRLPPRAARIVLIAFALRAGLALVQAFLVDLVWSTQDATAFERKGAALAEGGLDALVGNVVAGFPFNEGPVYSWLIGTVYWVLGVRAPLAIQAANVLMGTLAVVNAYRLGVLLWGRRAGLKVGLVAAVFPALVLWSAITMREAPFVLLLSYAALRTAQWARTGHARSLYVALASAAGAAVFHSGALAAAAAIVALAAVPAIRGSQAGRVKKGAGALGALLLVGVLLLAMVQLRVGFDKVLSPLDIASIQASQTARARGNAAYLTGLRASTPVDLAWQGPIRMVYVVFTPFPWQVTSGFQLIGLIDAAGYSWLAYLGFRNRRAIWRDPGARAVLVILGFLVLAFGLGTSNFGTAIRHRQKFVILFIALAGAAWRPVQARRGAAGGRPARRPRLPAGADAT